MAQSAREEMNEEMGGHNMEGLEQAIGKYADIFRQARADRDAINKTLGEARKSARDAGANTKAIEAGVRLQEMEVEAQVAQKNDTVIVWRVLGIGQQSDMFEDGQEQAA